MKQGSFRGFAAFLAMLGLEGGIQRRIQSYKALTAVEKEVPPESFLRGGARKRCPVTLAGRGGGSFAPTSRRATRSSAAVGDALVDDAL